MSDTETLDALLREVDGRIAKPWRAYHHSDTQIITALRDAVAALRKQVSEVKARETMAVNALCTLRDMIPLAHGDAGIADRLQEDTDAAIEAVHAAERAATAAPQPTATVPTHPLPESVRRAEGGLEQ